ncbi:MAG: nucleotidyltransferase domain-containing protein [Eubacteriales bacterium]|nr:nucleotidyltransferase domain-containing protein [Eubacteriales bacterium]
MKKAFLDQKIVEEIVEIAKQNKVSKVILFGSRTRGDHTRVSDIDLAVSGGDADAFSLDVEENTSTLLTYDVVDLDRNITAALRRSIDTEGIILYEEI